jgi:hypothetical protein
MNKNCACRAFLFVVLVCIAAVAISQPKEPSSDKKPAATNAQRPSGTAGSGTEQAATGGNPQPSAPSRLVQKAGGSAPQGGENSAQEKSGGSQGGNSGDKTKTDKAPPKIAELLAAPSGDATEKNIALNSKLAVVLAPAELDHPAEQYVLFLNDSEVKGLPPAIYTTLEKGGKKALVYKLVRNSDNIAFWRELLGAPKHPIMQVTVKLGVRAEACKPADPCKSPDITIVGEQGPAKFNFELISWPWFWIATVVICLVVFVVLGHARRSTTLRDNLVPQLPPNRQTYSLARCQMAFWFVLIFAAFIFLYILLWDYNTVSTQALALMGISGTTALAAVAVDVARDSPADAVNRALQALGLTTYADVLRVEEQIGARQSQIETAGNDYKTKDTAAKLAETAAAASPGNSQLAEDAKAVRTQADAARRLLEQLQAEIQDRQNTLRTYEDKTRLFVSEGLLKDLTTDLNGPTVHRIQVLCWTVVLGGVFVVGVYHDLSMPPDFSPTLLALMGISSAGYVGFKYVEKNN